MQPEPSVNLRSVFWPFEATVVCGIEFKLNNSALWCDKDCKEIIKKKKKNKYMLFNAS